MPTAVVAPARTLGPAVARLFAANFKHTKGPRAGKPFVLEDWQRHDLDLIFEVDDKGDRIWQDVLYGVARGNGKSPIAAGIGLTELITRSDSPDVFCAAASREQASIVHGFAASFVEGGPLRDFMRPLRKSIVFDAVKGSLRTLSADGYLAHGLSISAAIRDELHAWTTDKTRELYDALQTAAHKRPDSILLDITTAGFDKTTLLGQRYDALMSRVDLTYSDDGCLAVGRDREAGQLMIWRGAPEGADPSDSKVWRACNPASWITDEALQRQARIVPLNVFRRLHLNQWTESEDAVFTGPEWDACKGETKMPAGAEVWLGVDFAEKRDSSAIAVVLPMADGRMLATARIIPPRKDGESLLPAVEAELRRLHEQFYVREVAFDPWQIRDMASRLNAEGMRMREFKQNDSEMVPASQTLHDLVTERLIEHDGDSHLRAHVLACESRQTSRGGWRIVKPLNKDGSRIDQRRKVDGAIALVMAVSRAINGADAREWGLL